MKVLIEMLKKYRTSCQPMLPIAEYVVKNPVSLLHDDSFYEIVNMYVQWDEDMHPYIKYEADGSLSKRNSKLIFTFCDMKKVIDVEFAKRI